MAYNDTQWIDNSLPAIDEINLNNIEKGIIDMHNEVSVHVADRNNPHIVTKVQVGLSNVDNTSDVNKPLSSATQMSLDGKSILGHTHDGSNGSVKLSHNTLDDIGVNSHANIDILLDMSLVNADALSSVTSTNKLITENDTINIGNNKLENVVEDLTPELGGTLDCLNKKIGNTKVVKFNGLYDNGTVTTDFTIDSENGQYQEVVIDGNAVMTIVVPINPCTIYLHIHQGTGGTVTLPVGKWVDGKVGEIIAGNGHDLLMIHYYGSYVFGLMSKLT